MQSAKITEVTFTGMLASPEKTVRNADVKNYVISKKEENKNV
jgi:hypothetical protein